MVHFKTIQPWRDSEGWIVCGWVEEDIKVLGRWRGDKRDFRRTERRLCCVRCLGKDWSLTNVVWYTEYWKQGQGFLPGHEFLGWSFCLIGQLDHFPNTFQQKGMQWAPHDRGLMPTLLWTSCYQCCNQRSRDEQCLGQPLSYFQVTGFLTQPWQAQQLLILQLRGSYHNTPFSSVGCRGSPNLIWNRNSWFLVSAIY